MTAFTIPLPLFPRLIDWYTRRESDGALLTTILRRISHLRGRVAPRAIQRKWDVVLLGVRLSPHLGISAGV